MWHTQVTWNLHWKWFESKWKKVFMLTWLLWPRQHLLVLVFSWHWLTLRWLAKTIWARSVWLHCLLWWSSQMFWNQDSWQHATVPDDFHLYGCSVAGTHRSSTSSACSTCSSQGPLKLPQPRPLPPLLSSSPTFSTLLFLSLVFYSTCFPLSDFLLFISSPLPLQSPHPTAVTKALFLTVTIWCCTHARRSALCNTLRNQRRESERDQEWGGKREGGGDME